MTFVLPSVEPSLTKSNSHTGGLFCIFSKRSRNNGKTCSSFRKGIMMLRSGWLISKRDRIPHRKDFTKLFHLVTFSIDFAPLWECLKYSQLLPNLNSDAKGIIHVRLL